MKKIILTDFREESDGAFLRQLKRAGYECVVTEEKEMPGLLKEEQVLLVVIPVRNRERALKTLQQIQDINEKTPVIVTGKLESAEERIYWLEQGAFECIPGNCSYGELEARLHVVLRRY